MLMLFMLFIVELIGIWHRKIAVNKVFNSNSFDYVYISKLHQCR